MTSGSSRRSFLRQVPHSLVKTGLQVGRHILYRLDELDRLSDAEMKRLVPRLLVAELSLEQDGRCIARYRGDIPELTIGGLTPDERVISQWFLGKESLAQLGIRAATELKLDPDSAFSTARSAFLKLAHKAVCAPRDPL